MLAGTGNGLRRRCCRCKPCMTPNSATSHLRGHTPVSPRSSTSPQAVTFIPAEDQAGREAVGKWTVGFTRALQAHLQVGEPGAARGPLRKGGMEGLGGIALGERGLGGRHNRGCNRWAGKWGRLGTEGRRCCIGARKV